MKLMSPLVFKQFSSPSRPEVIELEHQDDQEGKIKRTLHEIACWNVARCSQLSFDKFSFPAISTLSHKWKLRFFFYYSQIKLFHASQD